MSSLNKIQPESNQIALIHDFFVNKQQYSKHVKMGDTFH